MNDATFVPQGPRNRVSTETNLGLYSLQVCVTVYLEWDTKVNIFSFVANTSHNIFSPGILLLWIYALYNCSKKILAILLACFFCQAIVFIVLEAKQYNLSFTSKFIISTGPSIGSFAQEGSIDPAFLPTTPAIYLPVVLAFSVILFAFAIFAFTKHALQSKAYQGSWAVSPLIKLLMTDHTLYFLWFTLAQAVVLAKFTIKAPVLSVWIVTIQIILAPLLVIFGPPMVLSVRARDHDAVDQDTFYIG
ncbi:hypothetical protein BJ138DRAFT_1157354, partial [Hygrophoropsis aurantiaca]